MIKLLIDKKRCVTCGNCEAWLPGLMAHVPRGFMAVESADTETIRQAIDSCPLDALTMEATNEA
ncbi:MAG: (4Fe-4S)-binding protein [Proteobacteria bacterium]|nr:(4Fe-4S)-binding protein [Pseudomonadota bacterium]